MLDLMRAIALLILSLVGLFISLYFTLVYYGVVAPDAKLIPAFCRLDESTCQSVLFTPYGSIFWLPNSIFGSLFYMLLIGVSAARLARGAYPMLMPTLGIAVFAALFSVYLFYALMVKLKVP